MSTKGHTRLGANANHAFSGDLAFASVQGGYRSRTQSRQEIEARVGFMSVDLVTRFLPILTHPLREAEFNVFDVMHHGTHEKQLSNVFAWLLDREASHRLDLTFQRIFVEEVNRALPSSPAVEYGPYSVRQEVNTSPPGTPMDIADLVLESHDTVLVIENYFVADGHGHSFQRYQQFGAREGKRGVVVMLCGSRGSADLTDGWDGSAVVTYPNLVQALARHIAADNAYERLHPHQHVFIKNMERHFLRGRQVNDYELVNFVEAICAAGEAGHYGSKKREAAAINFADTLRAQALDRFGESVDLLRRLKSALFNYTSDHLREQINHALDADIVGSVYKNYSGNFEWTIGLYRADDPSTRLAQIKFGPSAWYANERDTHWQIKVPTDQADYSRLFLTRGTEIRQSQVSLHDVLDLRDSSDLRLRDELLALISG